MSPQFVDAVRFFIEQLQYYGRESVRLQERSKPQDFLESSPASMVPFGLRMVIGGVGHWAEYWCNQLGLLASILWMKKEGLM